ncbi:protein ZBED8-like, partial [Aphis craccivora]
YSLSPPENPISVQSHPAEIFSDLKLGWIQKSAKGSIYFHCKACRSDYIGGIAALKKHSSSKKHCNNITAARVPSIL